VQAGLEQAISRGLAYAPTPIWCGAKPPSRTWTRLRPGVRRSHQGAVPGQAPGLQLLALSFNWKKNLDDATIAKFQQELSAMGYKYQFITLAGIHNMWYNMYDLAYHYARGEGHAHYVEMVQEPELQAAERGYTFVAHQQEVGAGYFDDVTTVIQGGQSSVTALTGSTEEAQFDH
jgi:isocitrate lyase